MLYSFIQLLSINVILNLKRTRLKMSCNVGIDFGYKKSFLWLRVCARVRFQINWLQAPYQRACSI